MKLSCPLALLFLLWSKLKAPTERIQFLEPSGRNIDGPFLGPAQKLQLHAQKLISDCFNRSLFGTSESNDSTSRPLSALPSLKQNLLFFPKNVFRQQVSQASYCRDCASRAAAPYTQPTVANTSIPRQVPYSYCWWDSSSSCGPPPVPNQGQGYYFLTDYDNCRRCLGGCLCWCTQRNNYC